MNIFITYDNILNHFKKFSKNSNFILTNYKRSTPINYTSSIFFLFILHFFYFNLSIKNLTTASSLLLPIIPVAMAFNPAEAFSKA